MSGNDKVTSEKVFIGDLKDYRQPMITSLGIIMGFLLNFLANWAIENNENQPAIETASDWLIAITLCISLVMMLFVLYRLLNNKIDVAQSNTDYQFTFKVYMASILLSFVGILTALFI